MRPRAVLIALAVAGLGLALSGPATAATTGSDWPAYGRNAGHSSASFGDAAITPANAGHLRVAWQFAPGTSWDASPTVVGGRVYIGGRNAVFYALDASSGAVVWRTQLDGGSSAFCPAKGIVGTATVQPDHVDGSMTVYAPGAHYLYALDAATGAQKWRTAIGPATTRGAGLYFNWASPTVAGGRIFMGLAANCESHLIRGGVVALNQHTGAVQHTYYAVPSGKVGASIWSSEASDGKTVWATTGNPDPTGTTVDDSYSVVRLSASTLARLDRWTVPAGQADDVDFGSSPTLFKGVVGGVSTQLVGACNKNGVLYAWRAGNLAAGPVWSRQVAGSTVSGQGFCITSPVWDFKAKKLWLATQTRSLHGTPVMGAVREISPDDGTFLWEVGLPCGVTGTPVLNAVTRVLAVALANCPSGVPSGVRFFGADDGSDLGSVPAGADVFAQPVFAEGRLFVADEAGRLVAYAP